jgi:hypothetical protein
MTVEEVSSSLGISEGFSIPLSMSRFERMVNQQ